MALQTEPLAIGHALVVAGTVRVESANGVSRLIEPNSQIFLGDQIDTGSAGSVSVVLNDNAGTQLELGRMSEMIIDDDVIGDALPDLGDVAVEAGLVNDLLQNWESFEPIALLETIVPGNDADSDADEISSADSIPGLDGSSETFAVFDEAGDDGIGSMDDDLDITQLIPPPEDAS